MSLKSCSLWLGAVAIAFAIAAAPVFSHIPLPPRKGEIGRREAATPARAFTLINQDGVDFPFNPNTGKIVLVTFVYTTCPDVCPLFSAHFAAIQRRLQQEKRDDYLLLTISTDPERDTPERMKAYGEAFKADFRHWQFLTGPRQELARVWKDFGVSVRELNPGQIQHTNLTTLIDGKGIRRVNYYGDKWLEQDVLKDMARLRSGK